MGRMTLLAALLLSPAFCLQPAQAQSPTRVVVQDFWGPGAQGLRAQVLRGLSLGAVELVPRTEVEAAASRIGVGPSSEREFAQLAQEARVAAFLTGSVERRRRTLRLELQVRDGRSGALVSETQFVGRSPRRMSRTIRSQTWLRLGGAISSCGVPTGGEIERLHDERPPEATPYDIEEVGRAIEAHRSEALDPELFPNGGVDPELVAAPPASSTFVPEYRPLEVSAGLSAINRGFRYTDDPDGLGIPHDLPLGPAVALAAEWYPGAHFTNGGWAQLGLTADLGHSFAMTTAGAEGVYPTEDRRWSIGARYRIPIGDSRIVFDAAYGHHAFSVEAEHPRDPEPEIASVGYDHLRLGASARISLGDVMSLRLGGAWLPLVGLGELGEQFYFPNATGTGAEANVGAGYALSDNLELRADANVRLYFMDLGDGATIGGANDRVVRVTLGVAFRMDPAAL